MDSERGRIAFRVMRREGQKCTDVGASKLTLGTQKVKTFTEVRRRRGIKENIIKTGYNVRVPTKTDGEPLELSTIIRDVVIFAQSKYESNAQVLEALKLVEILLIGIQVAAVCVVEDGQ